MGSGEPVSDEELIEACRAGDESAWSGLIHRYRRLVYSIPVAYRLSASEADEVFQSVALKLFQNIVKLRQTDRLGAWLSVTARRECQARIRAGSRFRSLDDKTQEALVEESPDLVQVLHEINCEHTLSLAFERLEALCRALLGALYLEEPKPSYQEISDRLDRPVGSLGPTRTRCLDKLRGIYSELGGNSP